MASLPTSPNRFDGTPEPYKLTQDKKRDTDHRVKYAYGAVIRGEGSKPNARAMQPVKAPVKIPVVGKKKKSKRGAQDAAFLTSPDESSDESTQESPEAIAPDADIAYSFDNKRGPLEGKDILTMAITKAIDNFETKETDRIVKDEYDVLGVKDIEKDEDLGCLVEDGFELI